MIERGHTLQDIRGYTLLQLRTFTEAAERARRRAMVDDLANLRAAQYDNGNYAKYLKALQK